MFRFWGRRLLDWEVKAEDLCQPCFIDILDSADRDPPVVSSVSQELSHAQFQQIGRQRGGKRRAPSRSTVPHFLNRTRAAHVRAVGQPKLPGGAKRVRGKSSKRKLLRGVQKTLAKTTARTGGLRFKTWWINKEMARRKRLAGENRTPRGLWTTQRRQVSEQFELLRAAGNLEDARQEQSVMDVANEVEAPEPGNEDAEMAASPYGMGSFFFPAV